MCARGCVLRACVRDMRARGARARVCVCVCVCEFNRNGILAVVFEEIEAYRLSYLVYAIHI